MKKLMSFVIAVFAIFAITACSSNSPKDVAEKAMKCIVNQDYKGYVDLIYLQDENKSKEDVDKAKAQLVELLQNKGEKSIKENEGVESFEVTKEEISEDGNSATVDLNITYKNGKTDDTTVKLCKDKNGKWWIDLGK